MLIGHKKQWDFLRNKFEANQLSHAYLFSGPKEIGKKTFAIEFAKFINCESDNKPCEKCVNCLMIEKNSFPDFKIITKNDPSGAQKSEIDISQIREVQKFLSYKSYYGYFKIVVIDDAEKMNQEAQSCFLKTLEEPKGKTLLIMVSSKPDMLLRTITSRCQTLKFFNPKELQQNPESLKREKEILRELLLIMDSDLSDKFKYVKSIDFEKQNAGEILEVMQKYLRYLLLAEFGSGKIKETEKLFEGVPADRKYPLRKIKEIINLTEELNNKMLFTNASPKLALEILLMEL